MFLTRAHDRPLHADGTPPAIRPVATANLVARREREAKPKSFLLYAKETERPCVAGRCEAFKLAKSLIDHRMVPRAMILSTISLTFGSSRFARMRSAMFVGNLSLSSLIDSTKDMKAHSSTS